MRSDLACLLRAVVVTLFLAGCQVGTDPYGRTVVSTPTLGEALGLSRQPVRRGVPYTPVAANGTVQEQRVVAGRNVQVVATGTGHAIVVDGRVLSSDADDDRVMIEGVYEGGGRTYVLFEEQSGGTACPSMYQAVDVSGSESVVSQQIGNCSDLPHVSVIGGVLRISVPAFRAAAAKTFMFKDGRLVH